MVEMHLHEAHEKVKTLPAHKKRGKIRWDKNITDIRLPQYL